MRCTVNANGGADYATIGEALAACEGSGERAHRIELAAGQYREKLVVSAPGVTLVGAGADKTRIVHGDGANRLDESGQKLGTFRTATLRAHADDLTLGGLTIENDAGPGESAGQAVALYLAGDRACVRECRLIGQQDTLLIAPDWGNPAEPEACGRRAYLAECLVRGNVDFIFGSYRAWFERCELYCVSRGRAVNAMIAAPNTPAGQPHGFVFHQCAVIGDCEPGTVFLGRPWRPAGRAAFLHCRLPECVAPQGFMDWETPFRPVWAGLCETRPADASRRHPGEGLLTEADAARITREAVLSGADGWSPWRADSR